MIMFVAGIALGAAFSKFWIAGYEMAKAYVVSKTTSTTTPK